MVLTPYDYWRIILFAAHANGSLIGTNNIRPWTAIDTLY